MKARVKASGEIVEVVLNGIFYDRTDNKDRYYHHELDFNDTTDYWTRLEHQYAGMAMQGILAHYGIEPLPDDAANNAREYAHALVEMIKEERK